MKLFISYFWDSEIHQDWVRQLANDLIKNGISTILDQYELTLGFNMQDFMRHKKSILWKKIKRNLMYSGYLRAFLL